MDERRGTPLADDDFIHIEHGPHTADPEILYVAVGEWQPVRPEDFPPPEGPAEGPHYPHCPCFRCAPTPKVSPNLPAQPAVQEPPAPEEPMPVVQHLRDQIFFSEEGEHLPDDPDD